MSEDGEKSRSPDDYAQSGLWEVEPLYYNVPGRTDRSRRGKAYRNRADGEMRCFEAHDGVVYRPGDHVYIETSPCDPYLVGSITMFKMSKRDMLTVKISRFFRPEDVPEISLSLILQERTEMDYPQEPIQEALSRELFSSETSAVYSISCLRGKCDIAFVKDIRSLGDCDLTKDNSFFSCLSFNQESSRLASVQGEIRVGASYQAKLPAEASSSVGDDTDRDELLYRPGMIDPSIEEKYIKLARSFRMFAMFDTKMTDTEKHSRVSDLLFDDALVTLHRCGYKFDDALKEMNANDQLLSADANFMTSEDTKKFGKGIKTFGKNFVRISRELLPLHSRDQLVGYYYLWKKTSEATKPKALSRQRNQAASLKRATKNGQSKASRPASTELLDYASASESEMEGIEAESKATQYACHHCYGSKSRDWHHAGREGMLLCTECRLFYKKYGQLRPVDRPSTVPPCLFKRSPSGTDHEEESGVRTRAGKKERRRTPSMGDERRSPSQAVSIHEFELDKTSKPRNGKRKRSHINGSAKKKKEDVDEDSGKEEDRREEVKETPESKEESVDGSTNSETASKEEPALNGSPASKQEVINEEIKEEEVQETTTVLKEQEEPCATMVIEQPPVEAKEEIEFEEESTDGPDENSAEDSSAWKIGDQEACSSKNAIFVQSIVRKCGQLCARTDLTYRLRPESSWDLKRREKKEKVSQPQPATPTQSKKPEFNGMPNGMSELSRVTMNGQIPPAFGGMVDPIFAMMQAQAHHQHAQQAQMIEAQAQQQQQLMKQIEMQRHLQAAALQRDAAGRISMMPFMDQHIANLPFMQGQQADMQRLQMDMLQAQQMSAMGQMGAQMGPPGLVPPELSSLMMQPILQQMIMAGSPMAMPGMPGGLPPCLPAGLPAGLGLHPSFIPSSQSNNLIANSDMMRRLQQEGFPMRPQ